MAGEAGYELEDKTDTAFAAMMIYKASGYNINPSKFYLSNEEALVDMKALAEQEAKQQKGDSDETHNW